MNGQIGKLLALLSHGGLIVTSIPAWHLYGENTPFPDVMHLERIVDRAAGLDWHIGPHRHAHLAQVFLLERGVTRVEIEGGTNRPEPPCILYIPPGTVHGFTFDAGTEGWVLTLPIDAHPELFADNGELASFVGRHFNATAPAGLSSLFPTLFEEWHGRKLLRHLRLRAVVAQIFCTIFEPLAQAQQQMGLGRRDPRLASFLDLVARHHVSHWTIQRYSSELGVSVRNLARICRETTGLRCPPKSGH
ncbi:AraC family ligand binding domain-containing protein [Paracoccus sp. PAMC 22219]|uniref:AraC family ligand binding domain-containing protein n=1 Tax=Paracoccus sp. PAMC 22219 TaxID=1569209 RepID=UPI0005A802F6|nr:AraC family ligand binding domain-containing protein [Paracoccus sp. PAMC 22219]